MSTKWARTDDSPYILAKCVMGDQPVQGARWDAATDCCSGETCGCWSFCLLGYILDPGSIDGCNACSFEACNHGYDPHHDGGIGCYGETLTVRAYVGCYPGDPAYRTFSMTLAITDGYVMLFQDALTEVWGMIKFTPGVDCDSVSGTKCNIEGFVPDGRDSMSGGGPYHNTGPCQPIPVDTSNTFIGQDCGSVY